MYSMTDLHDIMDINTLSTDHIHVIAAYIGLNPISMYHGYLHGEAVLTNEVELPYEARLIPVKGIRFVFRVHDPAMPGRWKSNQMVSTNLRYLPQYDIDMFMLPRDTYEKYKFVESFPYGANAFLTQTPKPKLSEEDLDCKRFIEHLQKVSRQYRWIDMIKKQK
jgi:hypothetical protein